MRPEDALAAFGGLTLYTNGEPCPMCAAAIRWAGFRECVYGTSLESLVAFGWQQIGIRAAEVFARSGLLPTVTELVPDVLAEETDPLFAWQYDANAPCPEGCRRAEGEQCRPV
jgi:tRNA(Arg) A34 adenosine deaminase TadA